MTGKNTGLVTLTVAQIAKRYPNGVQAVRDLSLSVAPGEVFGLVGANGAGKTTLLKLISGLLRPECGRVLCNDIDVTGHAQHAAQWIGLMPDPLGVYTDVSAMDYLEFFARTLCLSPQERKTRIDRVITLLELAPWLAHEVETLSAGWQRRLALGRMLLAEHAVLLLDEPAAGLDIHARNELLRVVRRLADARHTIIVSSHILPELQQLADRFGIMKQGEWVEIADGHPFFDRDQLQRGLHATRTLIRCANPEKGLACLRKHKIAAQWEPGSLHIVLHDTDDACQASAVKALIEGCVDIFELYREQHDLNAVVLDLLERNNDAS